MAKPLLLSTSLLALAACGGGGGGDTGGTSFLGPDGDGPLTSFDMAALTAGFVSSWASYETAASNLRTNIRYSIQNGSWGIISNLTGGVARTTNAILSSGVEYAHAAGLTGAGEIVAVIDGGFLETHEAIDDAVLGSSPSDVVDGHGTSVAGIIAGESSTFIGIAPGAQLYLQDFFGPYSDLAFATDQARLLGAVAQNNSWGPLDSNDNELLATTGGLSTLISQGASTYLTALENYAANGVVVFAVSNDDGLTTIDLMAGLPSLAGFEDLEEGWLAVANGFPVFDNAGNLTNVYMISASCLEAARWCITANGQWEHLPTDVSDTSYDWNIGSSFAAPQVAGAMAILAEAFPTLSPHELRIRLLASADNDFFHDPNIDAGIVYEAELVSGFFHEYSTVYGHGFLNIAAALLPIGGTTMLTTSGKSVDTNEARFVSGTATGDAISRALASIDIDVTDGLGAGFKMPGDALAGSASPRALAAVRLSDALSSDLTRTRLAPVAGGRSAFADHEGRSIDLTSPFGDYSASVLLSNTSEDAGIEVTKSFGGDGLRFDLGLKVAHDDSGLIGFGDQGADMAALRLGLAQDFSGGGFFSVGAEFGVASLDAPATFTDISTARYDSFGFEVGRRNVFAAGDRIALGVSMPIAVTSGSAELMLPVTRDGTRSVLTPIAVDLAPSERQVDMTFSYQVPMGRQSEMLFELTHADNFGNQPGLTDTAGVLAMKWSF